jgi:hypothetical protein
LKLTCGFRKRFGVDLDVLVGFGDVGKHGVGFERVVRGPVVDFTVFHVVVVENLLVV